MKEATIQSTLSAYYNAFCGFINKKYAFDPDLTDEPLWCECTQILDQIDDMLWVCRHYQVTGQIDWEFYEMISSIIRRLEVPDLTVEDLVSIKVINRTLDIRLFDRSLFVEINDKIEGKPKKKEGLKDDDASEERLHRTMTKVAPGEFIMDVVSMKERLKSISQKKKFHSSFLDFN